MASSAIALCELDDDQVQGVAAGPTHADVIVTAQDSGVYLYSTVSKDAFLYEHTCKELRDDLPVPGYGFLLLPGRIVPVQEQKQEWALDSSRLELSQAAAWDTRTEQFYTVAAVRPGAAKVAGKGPQQRLLGWPASYNGALEDAPLSMELHGAVHAAHPIYPAASAASEKNSPSEQTQKQEKAGEEKHNSSSAAERGMLQNAPAPEKQAGDSMQQTGALLHTKLPTIRTKSKQRPGKRKSAAGVAAAAVAAPTIAELPWMQEWIATGRTAEDREAEQEQPSAAASASGRPASATESLQQGIPGVFIVHTDGTIATDAAYPRHAEKQTNGSSETSVLASAAAEGRLAVVTKGRKRRQNLHLYMLQGNALQPCGEFQLQLPEKGAEVASVDISENRLALLWSNGVLQCFSHQAAPSGQISLRLQYHRKLSGVCEGVVEKIRPTTATPKKRAAIVPAQPSPQHAQHGRPSVRLCGSGLLAVAAHVHPEILTAQAAPEEPLQQSNVMQTSALAATDHRTSNGPVATPNKVLSGGRRAAETDGKASPYQQVQPSVLRVAVLDDTYGCVQHIRDLQKAELGTAANASAASQPKQLQILALQQGRSLTLVLGLHSRVVLLGTQAEPVTLAGMVGALSLNRQQQPAAALRRQALELQHTHAPVHSHFRPCWAQRGAAVGLPMLPNIDRVAVEVPMEKLDRWQSAAESIARDCKAEQEALQQLSQPGSLPSAEAARSLVHDITARSQEHGSGVVSQELLQLVVERCIETGYWDALQLLAQQPQLPAFKALQSMLPRLAEQGQLLALACALTQARDISHAHLGASLSVLLGGASADSLEATKQWSAYIASAADAAVQAAEASFGVEGAHEAALVRAQALVMVTEGFSAQEVCLHAALAAGHDQAVLQAALQRLQQPQVVCLIGYLLKWVDRHPGDDEACSRAGLAAGLVLPSMEAVLRWACATLDMHFITLAGLPAKAQQALLSLQERIQESLQMSQGVVALSGAMDHIKSQAPLPFFSPANPQQYFVELLDLGVRAA